MKNPILDKKFLKELDRIPLKEVYAEIIALNDDDEVLETIEGHVTAGSVNIDGASSVRRTCSLTVVADELNIHEYYWGLHTKFKLSLGVKNDIDSNYPEIIWFKQGTFVISSFTTSQALSNYTINIQGKDKMAKLNGEMGGTITSLTHDFGKVIVQGIGGDYAEEDLLLKDIIIGAVHQFANEPMYNIIVNDLEDQGLELLEYRGDKPFYMLINEKTSEPFNVEFNGSTSFIDASTGKSITLDSIPANKYNPLFDMEKQGIVSDYMKIKNNSGDIFSVAKIEYGQTAGYRMTPLVYAGDLILNVGETVTAMLDKIVAMLGQYEYFYDIDGKFIFQRKKTYFNTSWNNIVNNEDEQYIEPSAYTSAVSYSFEDGLLVASYQNNPNYANIRNDYSVWGTKKSVTGQELPVHMRYAIDKKPTLFVNKEGVHFTTMNEKEIMKFIEDWYIGRTPPFYVKKPNPKGLSEDWWDIFDWAEYYKKSTGNYPDGRLREYCTSDGAKFTEEEMFAMFPKGDKTTMLFTKGTNIFDVEPDGTLGYTNHGVNCTHYYMDYFIKNLQARGATAYIYKPVVKEEELTGGVVPQLSIKTDLDWRELIYQMALDYNKHHLDEDYYIKLSELNYGNFMNGKTGYEQYYVDMEAFWRDLYDPDYTFSLERTYVSKSTYDETTDLYYAKDKYIQCDSYTVYSSSTGYYTKEADSDYKYYMLPALGLSKIVFDTNPSNYYYIDAKEPYEIVSCFITEPYHKDGKGYYKQDNSAISYISESTYNANPSNYYQVKSREYIACVKVIPYSTSKAYCDKDGNLLNPQPTEEEYNKRPGMYYYKKYGYTQCKEEDKFNENIGYYKATTAYKDDEPIYAKVQVITEEIFDKNKTQYYTRDDNLEIVQCITLLQADYISGSYFEKVYDETLKDYKYNSITITNSDTYKSQCEFGNVYFYKTYYECCQRYLDYNPSYSYYKKISDEYGPTHWHKNVSISPESLTFWFDFLDEDSELQKFGCHSIGNRPKAVNDNQVKAIYFRETPTVIFIDSDNWNEADKSKLGYTYLNLPSNMASLFTISSQGKSAKTVVDEYIYKYACVAENITISVLPIYHLEPNTRIFVRNDESGINGEYILVRYSLNLGNGSNMSISASKAVDRLY